MSGQQSLTCPAQIDQVRSLCQFVSAAAVASGLSEAAVFQVELACDEACTNIVEHGYPEAEAGVIEIRWEVVKRDIIVTIRDNGRPFDLTQIPEPTPPTVSAELNWREPADLQVGGLGIHFIKQLMDQVTYHSDEDGNTLTLVKKIDGGGW